MSNNHHELANFIWSICNLLCGPSTGRAASRKGKVQLIDARQFWVQMEKSMGNKRRRIGDPSDKEKDPDHIGKLTKIFGNFRHGETRTLRKGSERGRCLSRFPVLLAGPRLYQRGI